MNFTAKTLTKNFGVCQSDANTWSLIFLLFIRVESVFTCAKNVKKRLLFLFVYAYASINNVHHEHCP